jgi:hypothetical protein
MSSDTLRDRGVQANLRGAAMLENHRLAFTLPSERWTGRAADILPAAGHEVWGVLWDLADPTALDPYERRYSRAEFEVTKHPIEHEARIRVFAYTVKSELRAVDEAPPASAYVRRMIEGAIDAGLPDTYIEHLRRWAT